ncbi:HrpB1 family type III secretion system apparatus protein [Dickeya chrysanthemi]|uniref:HrpB1 family type III secretion system apparatus protein n=1 Tax=Dickeya chrysanthemi TaxID=556 RepID=UPI00333F3571
MRRQGDPPQACLRRELTQLCQCTRHQRLLAAVVLAAVRVLRPELKALDTFDAWIAIKRGSYLEGARLLRDLEADAGSKPLCKALYACCLFAVGDASWHGIADGLIVAHGVDHQDGMECVVARATCSAVRLGARCAGASHRAAARTHYISRRA